MDILRSDPILFNDGDLSATLRAQGDLVRQAVERVPQPQLLSDALDELVESIVSQHRVVPLELYDDKAYATKDESSIPVDRLPGVRLGWDAGHRFGPSEVPGFTVRFHVPFSGDPSLFRLRPNRYTSNPPRGVVDQGELVFTFQSREVVGHLLQQEYEQQLKAVQTYVGNQLDLVDDHNQAIEATARRLLSDRIDRIKKADAGAAALGVPLRRRGDAPTTYAAPEVRRRLPPAAASGAKVRSSTPPEPTLPDAEYTHILKVMRNMGLVLERSPSAFEKIGEEGIRWHFIVQLNGQYEGQATGETFNSNGKTDILVRSGERNIFIAECKFWSGPKAFGATVDQLLGYLTWRDTKAAIVLFNRDVQLSTVLGAVPEALRDHPQCGAPVVREEETVFSTVLTRKDDPARKIKLTVMVFEVPKRT